MKTRETFREHEARIGRVRMVIACTYKAAGYSLADVGEILGVSAQRARQLVERGKRIQRYESLPSHGNPEPYGRFLTDQVAEAKQ